MPEPAPLIVFSDEWGRHPSSCQHLIQHLLPSRDVTWVNTIGLRPPRLDRATAIRGIEKLRSWFPFRSRFPPREKSAGVRSPVPHILNPIMWPSFRTRPSRTLNRWLLTRVLRRATTDDTPPIIVSTLPVVADLVDCAPAARWVYYCVDDYATWPGLDGGTLQRMESKFVEKVDVAIAVSHELQTHLAKLGKPAHLLTHGVDLDFWRRPDAKEISLPHLTEPLILFWGVIDRRMDHQFVRALSDSMNTGTILLVGPCDCPDSELLRIPRVQIVPPVPIDELPALASRAQVLIAPYADLLVTRAMQPLKLKEYLVTGKPVVVRKLPATEEWCDSADVVETPEEFARIVLSRLKSGLPEEQRLARSRLATETWNAKAKQFEEWLEK